MSKTLFFQMKNSIYEVPFYGRFVLLYCGVIAGFEESRRLVREFSLVFSSPFRGLCPLSCNLEVFFFISIWVKNKNLQLATLFFYVANAFKGS